MSERSTAHFTAVLAVFVADLSAPPASGTTGTPRLWEGLVLTADFVGIVECTTAGVMVAKYNVVET